MSANLSSEEASYNQSNQYSRVICAVFYNATSSIVLGKTIFLSFSQPITGKFHGTPEAATAIAKETNKPLKLMVLAGVTLI